MNPVLVNILGFDIRYYSLMYIVALYTCMYLVKRDYQRKGGDPKIIEGLGFWAMLSGIIGGRIYYIILEWDQFKDNLVEVYAIWRGIRGITIHGGIIGGAIGIYLYCRIKKISFWEMTDYATTVVPLGQFFGRIGNLINGETHGVPTFTPISVLLKGNFTEWWNAYLSNPLAKHYKELVPWGMVFPYNTPAGYQFPNMPLHPTMIYEMILNFTSFIILYFFLKKNSKFKRGMLSGTYLIFYGIIRMCVSLFRADDLYFMGVKAPYLASVGFILVGSFLIYLSKKRKIS